MYIKIKKQYKLYIEKRGLPNTKGRLLYLAIINGSIKIQLIVLKKLSGLNTYSETSNKLKEVAAINKIFIKFENV